ncbi:unnamed protein product [Oikopleura dioica]|uniref:Uncharacterized protein n=1 Tax=Oikopleura dioica TaxID=34765 RepID=E4YXU8_OIKDI|nr:unnamed protein product [Oikopleura dioica]
MNSNEIGSQSLGKFHDEENNLTNSAHLYNDQFIKPNQQLSFRKMQTCRGNYLWLSDRHCQR